MAGLDDDIPPPPPPPQIQTPTQQTPYTVSTIKLPILKKGEQRSCVSTKDANQKFLRSLPSAWSQVSLIMRTKPGVDSLSFDDLYNNLRVFESDVKGSIVSSSSNQNVAFVSENTSSTNKVSTTYGVSNSFDHNSQSEHPSSYSFLANQSSYLQLDHEDLEQLDEFDLEEMDLKWQVAMISMRMKKFYKKTRRKLQFDAKEPVGFDKTKVECYNCHKTRHFARECRSKGNQDSRMRDAWNTRNKHKDNGRSSGKQEESKALVTLDGEGVDWTSHSEDEQGNYALMAYSCSGSNTEVTSCSKECKESYAKIKKLYDEQREELGDASIEIQAYTQALKKVEAQLVAHQQNQLCPKQSKPSESDTRSSDFDSCESNSSEETLESMPELVVNEPKVVCQPKVWSDAPIIEEYGSESDDEHESLHTKEQETPSFAFVNTDKHIKTPRQTIKQKNTCSKSPKPDKKDCSCLMSKKLGLGYRFTTKACFVCGSLSHLIRDCDFHEKMMAKQVELNKQKDKGNVAKRENINTARASSTNNVNNVRASSTKNVSTARHTFNSQAVLTNAARKINTVKPIVNDTAEVKAVSAVVGKKETAVKPRIITKSFKEQGY
ncbi:ribonuclease H-like domain-containing protein [Tanacetum coccineum]